MKRRGQEGFALLLVFAMASIVAVTLYVALPRVAFESQRNKEQLLIDRGHEYERAIQLYVRKFKRFPSKMEDLDNANGIRFLRHSYVDPMTGKSEWRLIHAGPGGVLLDSKIKSKDKKDEKAPNTFITEAPPTGGLPEAGGGANIGLRHRPSDDAASGANNPGGNNPGGNNPNAPIPPDPGQAAPSPGPTAANNGQLPPQVPSPVSPNPNGQPPAPPQLGQFLTPNPSRTGAPDVNEAAKLIGGILTNPRPGGLAGIQNAQAGQTIGGGIAGVASNAKGQGIKVFNDQSDYEKWEFVYDLSKEAAKGAGGLPQTAPAPGTPIGQPAPNTPNTFNGAPPSGPGVPMTPPK